MMSTPPDRTASEVGQGSEADTAEDGQLRDKPMTNPALSKADALRAYVLGEEG